MDNSYDDDKNYLEDKNIIDKKIINRLNIESITLQNKIDNLKNQLKEMEKYSTQFYLDIDKICNNSVILYEDNYIENNNDDKVINNVDDIIDNYDVNSCILDISNKNIKGSINLEKFKYLNILYCQNNKITEIINICNLKYLNCSDNFIMDLNLPDSLLGINCSNNPLRKLYYPINIKPLIYPKNLTHLIFGDKFNQEVNNLPNGLNYLKFGYDFDMSVDNLPHKLLKKEPIVKLSGKNKTLSDYPCRIKTLIFGHDFNQPIDKLPGGIEFITFGKLFNQNIDKLSFRKSLKKIYFYKDSNFDNPMCIFKQGIFNGPGYKLYINNCELCCDICENEQSDPEDLNTNLYIKINDDSEYKSGKHCNKCCSKCSEKYSN